MGWMSPSTQSSGFERDLPNPVHLSKSVHQTGPNAGLMPDESPSSNPPSPEMRNRTPTVTIVREECDRKMDDVRYKPAGQAAGPARQGEEELAE